MYATKQDMLDRYDEYKLVELTDRAEPTTGEINDAVLAKFLSDASETINSYIAARHKLPLAVVPGVLIGHACIIAFYKLHRGMYPEEIRTDYLDTIRFLENVSRGHIQLDAGGTEPASAEADARVEGPDRTFSRETMKVY